MNTHPHFRYQSLFRAILIALIAPLAQSGFAFPVINSVIETGGDNEPTDTITAKWTGVTFPVTVAGEPVPGLAVGAPYTVGRFGNHAPAFVDRNHRYTNASDTVPIPSYLLCGEYIMSGNDNRDNAGYRLDVNVTCDVQVYMLIDNRLGDPNSSNADPPSFGPTKMQWILDEGWAPVITGANRAGDPARPDEVGIDESADGTLNQWYSVYTKHFAAGTFQLKQADNAGQNMYGVVVVPATLCNFLQIGRVRTGSSQYHGTTPGGDAYTVVGGGNDNWDRTDEFAFLWHELGGDFDIKVQVTSVEAAGTWSKAGIAARESLAEDARRVFMCTEGVGTTSSGATAANTHELLWRTGAFNVAGDNGGQNNAAGGPTTFPNDWVRLVRQGSLFTGYRGTDGVNWDLQGMIDSATFPDGPLPGKLYIGLAVSRHPSAVAQTCKAEFTNYMETAATFCAGASDSKGCPTKIFVCFNKPVGDGALNAANYQVTGGQGPIVNSATLGPAPNIVCLDVEPLEEGVTYSVGVVNVKSKDGMDLDPNCVSHGFVHGKGYELRKIHVQHNKNPHDPGDNSLNTYLSSRGYEFGMGAASVERPGNEGNNLFEDPAVDSGTHENFSGRMVGVLTVGADGMYRFACSSDDEGRMFMSRDDQPAHKMVIGREPTWNGSRQYATCDRRTCSAGPGTGDNVSAPQALVAGGNYYLEFVYSEGGGGNNGSVTWDAGTGAPFMAGQTPIEEMNFVDSRFAWGYIFYNLGAVQLLSGPSDASNVPVGSPASFEVILDGTPPYTFQWKRNGVPIPGANGPRYTLASVTPQDNGARFSVDIANACGKTNSRQAMLSVLLNPIVTNCTSRGNCHAVYVQYNQPMRLDGVYTVVCSNTVSGLLSPLVVTGVRAGRTPSEVCLSVTPDLLPDTNVYCVTVLGAHSEAGLAIDPDPTTCCFIHGQEYPMWQVQFRRYKNINLADLDPTDVPVETRYNQPFLESPSNIDENYVGQTFGFWIVPNTGTYRFWMATDDPGQSFIATDAVPANKVQMCFEPQWAGIRQFASCDRRTCVDGIPQETQSPPFALTAGQKVYLEVAFQEFGGGDNSAIAASYDDPNTPEVDESATPPANGADPLSADQFMPMRASPSGENFTTLCDVFCNPGPSDQTVIVGRSATFTATPDGTPPYTLQWKKNGVPIPGANAANYTTPPVTEADHGAVYTLCVINEFSTNQCSATLRVQDCVEIAHCGTWGDPNHLYVFFNQPVNLNGNYTINNGAVLINSLAYGTNQSIVVASTDPFPADTGPYTLEITGVTGTNGEQMCVSPQTCTFSQGPGRFCTDFSGGLPAGTVASGTTPPAVGAEGALHLTDQANSQANFWTIPLAGVQTFDCLRASWKTLLGPGSGGIGNSADGFSFNVGQNLGTGFTPEEGAGNGLSVTVDTFNNGNNEVGTEVRWNGARLAFTQIAGGGVNGPAELMKNEFVDASVDVSPSGFVRFTYDTFVTTAQIPGFSGITANQYVFAARTGNANENCWIDDLCINDFTLGAADVTIEGCPQSAVAECTVVTLRAVTTGSPCHFYQWYKNGVAIAGANSDTYTTPPLLCTPMEGPMSVYRVVVRNHFSQDSAECAIRINSTCPPLVLMISLEGNPNPPPLLTGNVVIKWVPPPGDCARLQGAAALMPAPGNSNGVDPAAWVNVQAGDPDVVMLMPGMAVIRATSSMKFFRLSNQ